MAKPNKKADEPKDWKLEAVYTARSFLLRMVDREQMATALAAIFLLIWLVLAIRLPVSVLEKIPDALSWTITHGTPLRLAEHVALGISLAANIVLIVAFRLKKRTLSVELERMAGQKRELEARLDPKRPPTYLPTESEEHDPDREAGIRKGSHHGE